ncbi:MAG TPA: helix-turn-helix domain-containing protein [Bryobacteraceae bacterium]|nr:helix-turn-helix domain-containing protein [Bryobacteraceae bacterium]
MSASVEVGSAGSVQGLVSGNAKREVDESARIEKLWTPDEVASLIDVKASWVMDHVTRIEPIIPHIRIGKMIRFKRQAVMEWLDSMVSTKATWE